MGSNLSFRDLRRWINQEREISSSLKSDVDYHQRLRHRTITYHGNSYQISPLSK